MHQCLHLNQQSMLVSMQTERNSQILWRSFANTVSLNLQCNATSHCKKKHGPKSILEHSGPSGLRPICRPQSQRIKDPKTWCERMCFLSNELIEYHLLWIRERASEIKARIPRQSCMCVFCVCTCLLWRGRRGCDRVFEIVILLTHVCVSLHVCMHVCDSCLPLPLCTTANCQLTVAYTISPSSVFSHILYPRLLSSSLSPSHPISFFLSLPFLVSHFFYLSVSISPFSLKF